MTSETEKLRDELLAENALTVVSKFHPSTEFPLTNLDWNATSKPMTSAETFVQDAVWRGYGNPHSCGTLTGQTSGDIINECSSSVLLHLGIENSGRKVLYGGDGATYWLRAISRQFPGNDCVTVQEELHTSLTHPFIDQGCRIYLGKTLSWLFKFLSTRKPGSSPVILLVTLMSHLTGDEFNQEGLSALKNTYPETIIVVDATSYLAHRKRVACEKTPFDFLVFSGHKFPGGPGSPGCMVCDMKHEKRFHADLLGTPNVLGIYRLAVATRIRTRLMSEEDEGVQECIETMERFFINATEVSTKFVLHSWNPEPLTRRAPVFCFSVMLTDRNLYIHPQVVASILLNAYGIQIRAGGHCSDTVISRTKAWGQLLDVDISGEPILQPSVCRISFPRYLVNKTWVKSIIDKLTDFLRCARFYLRCFTPSPESWSFNEEFITLTKRSTVLAKGIEEPKSRCSSCARGMTTYKTQPPAKSGEGGCLLYTKISATVINNLSPKHSGFEHPFRWFALPEESKIADTGNLNTNLQ
jgi:selenocysteine lyase/cysteine desulfurase